MIILWILLGIIIGLFVGFVALILWMSTWRLF